MAGLCVFRTVLRMEPNPQKQFLFLFSYNSHPLLSNDQKPRVGALLPLLLPVGEWRVGGCSG